MNTFRRDYSRKWGVHQKEMVGGYALIEVGSRDEAVELATRFMEIHRKHWPEFEGTCEVR